MDVKWVSAGPFFIESYFVGRSTDFKRDKGTPGNSTSSMMLNIPFTTNKTLFVTNNHLENLFDIPFVLPSFGRTKNKEPGSYAG